MGLDCLELRVFDHLDVLELFGFGSDQGVWTRRQTVYGLILLFL